MEYGRIIGYLQNIFVNKNEKKNFTERLDRYFVEYYTIYINIVGFYTLPCKYQEKSGLMIKEHKVLWRKGERYEKESVA